MDEKKTLEIISTVPLTEGQQNRIRGLGKHIRLTVSPGKAPTDLPKDAWEKAEVLFADGKQLPTREQAPALKWVQTALAGVDRALAQPLASDPEIVITSASGVMVSQMGEYVLMALLILGHKLPETMPCKKNANGAAILPDLCSPWNCAAVRLALSATGPSGGKWRACCFPWA